MHTLSADQKLSLDAILNWFQNEKEHKQYISLGGYAGTGKTTLIALIRNKLHTIDPNVKVGFASYTGKAARVLRTKLMQQQVVLPQDTVGTIHSLIYSPIVNERKEIVGWKQKESIDRTLIIIDEASMVDEVIWGNLRSYGIPIIVVGDHGQLPPIKGSFNLIEEPQLTLDEIHRQARMNPIIGLSIQAREHGCIKFGTYSDTVIKYDMASHEAQEAMQELLNSVHTDTLVLCGYNSTRIKLNTHIRGALGFETAEPAPGDRVICLRNNHKKHIFNGMLGTLQSIKRVDDAWYMAEIVMDDEEDVYKDLISVAQFNAPTAMNFTDKRSQIMRGDLFDFGYALTVHKAQGSQAKRVILFEERFRKMSGDEWKRWLYTAVTRAEEELYIFGRDSSPNSDEGKNAR